MLNIVKKTILINNKFDKFWRTYADDLGVIYESNYDYLKFKPSSKPKEPFNRDQFNIIMKLCN